MLSEDLNRFDRTLAILILLQSKKLIKAQDLADRFDVSLRTIYRDIRSLEAAGVPIIGEAGVGYSIMDGYRLPPVMFTKEEAASFVAAEKLMQTFTDASLGAYFETAIHKVKSVLRGQEKDWITALEKQIRAAPRSEPFNKKIPNALEILFNSIAEQKQVTLEYRSLASTTASIRTVEPVGVFYESERWYLLAFCLMRNDYRQFRTDRIITIKRIDQNFTRKHGSIDDHKKTIDQRPTTTVTIAVIKDVVRHIADERRHYGFVSEKETGDEIEMTFESRDPSDGLARWYMMFGDCARIIGPESFRERVRTLAKKTKDNLSL